MKNILSLFTNKETWKNKTTYLSLLAYVPMVLATFKVQVLPGEWIVYEHAIKAILDVLVLLGILNNPNTQGYSAE